MCVQARVGVAQCTLGDDVLTRTTRQFGAVAGMVVALTFGVASGTSAASPDVTASSYAASLLATAPVPAGAQGVSRLPHKLESAFSFIRNIDAVHHHRFYLLARGINLLDFLHSHLPGDHSVGTNLSDDTAATYTTGYELGPDCADRHVASCRLGYTVGTYANGLHELRIDAYVVWVPVHIAQLPTTGVVTLTAYDELSLANPPTHPVAVVLSSEQVTKLGAVLSDLRSEPDVGMCAEDTPVYRIDVAPYPGALDTWSAVDHSCGGLLTVLRQQGSVSFGLNGNACAIQHLVAAFLPPGEARASRDLLKPCSN